MVYYFPGSSVTTVTVTSSPVITTTTTEIFEDHVTSCAPGGGAQEGVSQELEARCQMRLPLIPQRGG